MDNMAAPATARPFSWAPVIALVFCMTVNLSTVSLLFPYVGFMVANFQGIPGNEAGYVAGYVTSALTVGRMITGSPWGWAADRFGRIPVMLWNMVAIAVFSIAFGMSDNLAMAIITRLCLGLMNGSVSTGRVLVPELVGEDRVVAVMGFIEGSRPISYIIGVTLGGMLSEPAEHFPSTFSRTGIFGRYPYLLPNLVLSCLAIITIPLVVFFIPETRKVDGKGCRHDVKTSRPSGGTTFTAIEVERAESAGGYLEQESNRLYGAVQLKDPEEGVDREVVGDGDGENGVFTFGDVMSMSHVPTLLGMTLLFSAVNIGLDDIFPLWALSTDDVGGLEYNARQIGQVMSMAGLGYIVFLFVIYPRLVACFGITTVQNKCGALAVVFMLVLPNAPFLSWNDSSLVAASVMIMTFAHSTQEAMNVGMVLAGTNPAPPRARGKLSGLFATSQSLGKSIGPAVLSPVFAWSISAYARGVPLVDYRFVFTLCAFTLGVVALMGVGTLTSEIMVNVVKERPEQPEQPTVELSSELNDTLDVPVVLTDSGDGPGSGTVVIEDRRADFM